MIRTIRKSLVMSVSIRHLLCLLIFLPALTTWGEDLRVRAEDALEKALTAMATYQRHGGWATAWSKDEGVVWGEFLPIPETWITVQAPATPKIAGVYLRAGKALEAPRWIAVAGEAHAALRRIQSAEGGFPHEGPPVEGNTKRGTFDDGTTTDSLQFFLDWWHHTGSQKDRDAVDRVGEFLLMAQYPDSGGWPQAYPPPNNYGRCITFNDGNYSNIMSALFAMHRETGDVRYRDAALRGAEGILKLQGIGEESIWAQQYDPQTLEPAWARKFEPPGYTPAESSAVCNTLVEVFVETGDERYMEALGRALTWYEGHKLPNGKYARLYEPGTQRPVYGRRDKAVKVYDFADACDGYGWQGTWYPTAAKQAWDAYRTQGKDAFLETRRRPKTANYVAPKDETIQGICDRLGDDGLWTRKPNSTQLGFYEKNGVSAEVPMVLARDFNTHVTQLLDYLQATATP